MKWFLIVLSVLILLLIFQSRTLQRRFNKEVKDGLNRTTSQQISTISEADISSLPEPVQKYLRYVGVVGKEKINNYKVKINGEMKTDLDQNWRKVTVEQFSTLDEFERHFLLKMNMGVPVVGLHSYSDYTAIMNIKVLGSITVVDGKGDKMDQAETVTVFNDMCILAPASLIDKRIEWDLIDSLSTNATFTNGDIKVTATLYFNDQGQLINFVSNDRYFSPDAKTFESVQWSTPVSEYKNINGYNLATFGEAIWKFPEGDFSYAKFNILDVKYNIDNY